MSYICSICSKEYDSEKRYLSHVKRCAWQSHASSSARVGEDSSHSKSSHSSQSSHSSHSSQFKQLVLQLKKRLDESHNYIRDLTEERDSLIEELNDEREHASSIKERFRESYNRKLRLYKEHLELKYGKQAELTATIDQLKDDLQKKTVEHHQELRKKEEEIQAFKNGFTEVQTKIKYFQTKYESDLKNDLLVRDNEYKQRVKLLQQSHDEEIRKLNNQVNELHEQMSLQKVEYTKLLEKQDRAINIAVSKKENEMRQFFDEKLGALRLSIDKEKTARESLTKDYEERIKNLKADFMSKLNGDVCTT